MKTIELSFVNEFLNVIGQGTFGIVQDKSQQFYDQWRKVLLKGIELGMTVLDTSAEYGNGLAERLVGEVVSNTDRNKIFLITKSTPYLNSVETMENAVNNSLDRLGVDIIDLYLVPWYAPKLDQVSIMERLEQFVDEGKVRFIGTYGLSLEQFKEAQKYTQNYKLIMNQVPISITENVHIQECLPYYQDADVILAACSPLNSNGLKDVDLDTKKSLKTLADKYGVSIQQIALAWLISQDNLIVLPRTMDLEHLKQNYDAGSIQLSLDEIKQFYLKMIDGF